jgi:hypothetical protein
MGGRFGRERRLMTRRGEDLLRIAAGFIVVTAVLAAVIVVLALGMR